MDIKLTIKLDREVIEKAKSYAQSHKRSLSRMIESYLQSITELDDSEDKKTDFEISPFVKSISTGVHLPTDLDYKSEYSNFLTEKYR